MPAPTVTLTMAAARPSVPMARTSESEDLDESGVGGGGTRDSGLSRGQPWPPPESSRLLAAMRAAAGFQPLIPTDRRRRRYRVAFQQRRNQPRRRIRRTAENFHDRARRHDLA